MRGWTFPGARLQRIRQLLLSLPVAGQAYRHLSGITAGDVLSLVSLLQAAGLQVWVSGGWGVDVLVGRKTRRHADLDMVFEASEYAGARLEAVLAQAGFALVDSYTEARRLMGGRVIFRDRAGRVVDMHPVVVGAGSSRRCFDAVPVPVDDCVGFFDVGGIGGHTVPCLSLSAQLEDHTGFELEPVHLDDLSLLESLRCSSDDGLVR